MQHEKSDSDMTLFEEENATFSLLPHRNGVKIHTQDKRSRLERKLSKAVG